jgi:hypothetical protein
MYNQSITREKREMRNDLEMRSENHGAVIVGKGFTGTRKDGRYFAGQIVNVKALAKGTLVTIMFGNDNLETVHKSVYLEDMINWTTYVYREYETTPC